MVAMHCPTGIEGVLIGGSEDGTIFPIACRIPPLTIGMVSGTNPDDFYGCSCYSCAHYGTPADADELSRWMLAGLTQDGDGSWRWAYVQAASCGITRREQQLHDSGSAHSRCNLCRVENLLRTTSSRLPDSIRPSDATMHFNGTPHTETFCTACKAGLEIGALC